METRGESIPPKISSWEGEGWVSHRATYLPTPPYGQSSEEGIDRVWFFSNLFR